jgi:Fe-S oxidoreductase
MPLAAAQRYNIDTRDDGRRLRNELTGSSAGAFRCHYAGECSRACPKGVDPAKAIQHLKRRLVLDYLHMARRKEPCRKQHGPGQGKPLANVPAAPPRTVQA